MKKIFFAVWALILGISTISCTKSSYASADDAPVDDTPAVVRKVKAVEIKDMYGSSYNYSYDTNGRLSSVVMGGSLTESYTYTTEGTKTKVNVSYDWAGGGNYSYFLNEYGNAETDGSDRTYFYKGRALDYVTGNQSGTEIQATWDNGNLHSLKYNNYNVTYTFSYSSEDNPYYNGFVIDPTAFMLDQAITPEEAYNGRMGVSSKKLCSGFSVLYNGTTTQYSIQYT